ncbi:Uncharacterized protein QTN25_005629 [Entamoeba marina]
MQQSNDPTIRCYCCLCRKSQFFQYQNPKIKNTRVCILILKSLKSLNPHQDYFSMKDDIYNFIYDHWWLLEKVGIFKKIQWKKSILDAFNHCSSIESGKEVNNKRGFYRLKIDNKLYKSERMEYQRDIYSSMNDLQGIMAQNIKKLCFLFVNNELPNHLQNYNFIINEVDKQKALIKHFSVLKTHLCNLK